MVRELLRLGRLLLRLPGAQRKTAWADLKPLLHDRFAHRLAGNRDGNPTPPILFQMASGFWLAQAVYVAAKLGIADLLANGPMSCRQLAQATGAHSGSLMRLMQALSGVGIFSPLADDHFALASLGQGLRSGVPGSIKNMALTLGEIHYQACGSLLYSIQTGDPAFSKVFGASLFDYLTEHGQDAASFNGGMAELSAMLAYAVLTAYDFSRTGSITDVGGGEGELLNKILAFYPALRGTVFDLPSTIERAQARTVAGRRCVYATGNFFDSVPESADVYLLSGIVHDWDDDCALRILRNCCRAMAQGGKLLLLEMVVPLANPSDFSHLLDLNVMVMNGGRERTSAEFRVLLDAAGYKMNRIIPTLAPQSLIEATPK
jgi:SAM-dependent methyltransferase